MIHRSGFVVACASGLLLGSAAFADCQSELQQLTSASGAEAQSGSGGGDGIQKSGELAPLEDPGGQAVEMDMAQDQGSEQGQAADGSGTGGEGEGISKDGSMSPLESQAATTGIATSPAEVEAQQQGGDASPGGDRAAAIEEARTALAAGNEEACMEAVERARNM